MAKYHFGRRLKSLRKKHRFSQRDLAKRSGVSYGYIGYLEAGTKDNPSLDTIEKFAEAFEMSISRLLR